MKLPVVLEIGDQYLKILLAKRFGRYRRIFDYIIKPVKELTDNQIAELISKSFHEYKIAPSPLIISIPRNQVTVRNLHLPSQDKKEISQMLDLHIGRIIPYKKEETVYNYMFLGIDEFNYAKIVLAIAYKDILKRQVKIIDIAGAFIDTINLSSYGVWQWVATNKKSEINNLDLYLLLDIDSSFTDFIVFNRDNLLFTRAITMEITKDFKEHDVIKFIGEIKQSLVIFNNEEGNKKPVKIFLTGALIAESLQKMIEKEFNVPVILVYSIFSLEMFKLKKTDMPDNVSFSSLAELALGDNSKVFSFLLPEIQIRKSLREKNKEITLLGSMFIYVFTVIIAIFWVRFYNQQIFSAKLNQEIKLIKQDIGDLHTQYQKVEVVKEFLNQRKITLIILSELSNFIPSEISINAFSLDEQNKINLKGYAVQLSDVIKFTTVLEGSEYFKEVSTKSTRTKKIKNKLMTDFEITFELNDEGGKNLKENKKITFGDNYERFSVV